MARNLERHGVLTVQDFEHLNKEEFDVTIEKSDSSMRVIEARRVKVEHQKAHCCFDWMKHSIIERSYRFIPDASLSCITVRWKTLSYPELLLRNRRNNVVISNPEIISFLGSSSNNESNSETVTKSS